MNAAKRNLPGFTLVEMMFSLTLGTLILITAAGLLGSAGAGYGHTSGDMATRREDRVLFDRLGTDLASAVAVRDMVLESGASGRIAFVTLLPASAQSDDGRGGDACAVSYRLVDLESGGRVRRCLMRGVRESGETFAALRAGETGELFSGEYAIEEPLAFDVAGFEARPESSGTTVVGKDSSGQAPDVIEITLVLARPELARRMKSTADWDALQDRIDEPRGTGLESHTATLRFGNHAHP